MADTDFDVFSDVTSFEATDKFLALRAGGGVNLTRDGLFTAAGVAAGAGNADALHLRQLSDGGLNLLFSNSVATLAKIAVNVAGTGAGTDDGVLALFTATNGTLAERMRIDSAGNVGIGTMAPTAKLDIFNGAGADGLRVVAGGGAYAGNVVLFGVDGQSNGYSITKDTSNNIAHIWCGTGGAERARIDSAGNLLVGATTGTHHTIRRSITEGNNILGLEGASGDVAAIFAHGTGALGSGTASILRLASNSSTGRTINAGGTINASGADYAEYMRKSEGCGDILKGQVCGVDPNGELTTTWDEAISFVVKSTDPSYVGGDTWGNADAVGPRPEEPAYEGPEYTGRAKPEANDPLYDLKLVAWTEDQEAHAGKVAVAQADHADAMARHEAALAEWEAGLEAARATVDRIAFSGEVPCIVSGAFAVGDYIVAEQDGEGIAAVAVPEDDITFAQYRKRIGKVWAIRDGKAWIDVQHG